MTESSKFDSKVSISKYSIQILNYGLKVLKSELQALKFWMSLLRFKITLVECPCIVTGEHLYIGWHSIWSFQLCNTKVL